MTAAIEILETTKRLGLTISTAESCTGGMIAAALTDLPGSSASFERGFVTYSNSAKISMLGVKETTLTRFGAVSEEVASEMAAGALRNSETQMALSVTGIAGPGGSDHKPEGRVCFGLATNVDTHTETVEFGPIGRDAVRLAATEHGLALILRGMNEF